MAATMMVMARRLFLVGVSALPSSNKGNNFPTFVRYLCAKLSLTTKEGVFTPWPARMHHVRADDSYIAALLYDIVVKKTLI